MTKLSDYFTKSNGGSAGTQAEHLSPSATENQASKLFLNWTNLVWFVWGFFRLSGVNVWMRSTFQCDFTTEMQPSLGWSSAAAGGAHAFCSIHPKNN